LEIGIKMYEFFYKIPNAKWGEGVILSEYEGRFSLISGAKGNAGNVYYHWVFPAVKNKPVAKRVPMKVDLGTTLETIRMLEYLLKKVKGVYEQDLEK